jgi:outer membrane cobalamin receptor
MIRCFFTAFVILFTTFNLAFAQEGALKGSVKSDEGEPLIGVNVSVLGTKLGDVTNNKGLFEIKNIPAGTYEIRVSYVGFNPETQKIAIKEKQAAVVEFTLSSISIKSDAISVIASRAEFRETPVAFSNMAKEDLELKLGTRDIPMVLNETPGVYATEQGGGYGDARINIRGFDQRNVAVMINGVPVNDMENGWVYWSNWDGISDVTSSIQVQRGLGAGKIANPSVGGTMNIITDAARMKPGVTIKQDFGSGSLMKSTIIANTGNNGGFAASFMAVRKTAEGLVEKTWTDAWSYYLALSWDISREHKLDFYLTGAPQAHGQRSFRQSIATYDHQTALDCGIPDSVVNKTTERGILYNSHWGQHYDTTKIQEYYYGTTHDPHGENYLMERENYFHKPQMNLNWLWQIADNFSLTNVFYLSFGNGGGSGRTGPTISVDGNGYLDFDRKINWNINNIDSNFSDVNKRAETAMRNAVNNHFWTGWLGTVDYKPSKELRIQFGLDLRYYVGEHYQEVRNLLGGDYFIETITNPKGSFVDSTGDLNIAGDRNLWVKKLGDKIGYYYDSQVNWTGGFAQMEYKVDALTTYINLSGSNTGYGRRDYFRMATSPNGNETDMQNFFGYTAKVGANYNVNKNINFYGNVGYYSRAPLFNVVFNSDNGLYKNPLNEKILAFEAGLGYWEREFQGNLNLYYTNWNDRSWSSSSQDTSGSYINYNLAGIDALHYGAELELTYKPVYFLRIKGMLSLGNWTWTNNASAVVYNDANIAIDTINVYIQDLKVGNSAQKTFSLGTTFYPVKRAFINISYKYFWDNYSDFDPASRTNSKDRTQSWQMPNYGILDANLAYTISLYDMQVGIPIDMKIKANFFNLLDTKYISDAEDNRTNMKQNGITLHNAQAAEVWFGLPFRWGLGIEISY